MNCPTCGEEMVHIHGFNGFGYGDYVCQNDNCGDDVEWCHICDKSKTHCFCDMYEEEK